MQPGLALKLAVISHPGAVNPAGAVTSTLLKVKIFGVASVSVASGKLKVGPPSAQELAIESVPDAGGAVMTASKETSYNPMPAALVPVQVATTF